MNTQPKEHKYTVFNAFTGAIVQVGRCAEHLLHHRIKKPECQKLILGIYDPHTYYIDPDTFEPKEKKKMILIVKEQTICGIPEGSTLLIKELSEDTVTIKGDAILEIDNPGKYHVHVFNPQYHPSEVSVEVL